MSTHGGIRLGFGMGKIAKAMLFVIAGMFLSAEVERPFPRLPELRWVGGGRGRYDPPHQRRRSHMVTANQRDHWPSLARGDPYDGLSPCLGPQGRQTLSLQTGRAARTERCLRNRTPVRPCRFWRAQERQNGVFWSPGWRKPGEILQTRCAGAH